jgi:uncharacterized membrane protein
MSEQAAAQPSSPCTDCIHRIIDLGPIPAPSLLGLAENQINLFDRHNTFGINAKGQVVFAFDADPGLGVSVHAGLWLPNAAYGLAKGFHDLHALANPPLTPGQTFSIANDINDEGIAVGLVGTGYSTGHAYVWRIKDFVPATGIPVQDLHSTSGPNSVAHAINDASPAVVVGSTTFFCPEDDPYVRGFRRALDAAAMSELLPGVDSNQSWAFDASTTPLRIAGTDRGPNGDPCIPVITAQCDPDRDALQWQAAMSFLPEVFPRLAAPSGAEARAINNAGQVAGVSLILYPPPPGGDCGFVAAVWGFLPSPLNLNTVLPSAQLEDRTRAEGITDAGVLGRIKIVGSNQTANRGELWEHKTDGTLCAADLFNVTLPCGNDLIPSRGHAINPTGQITGYARKVGETFDRAYVLTCRADLDGNLIVNRRDQDLLHLAYGSCPDCPEDLNCDDVIDAVDLEILIRTASGTAICTIEPLCPIGGGIEAGAGGAGALAGGGATLEQALAMFGFDSIDGYAEWSLAASDEQADAMIFILQDFLGD